MTTTILDQIVANRRSEVERLEAEVPISVLERRIAANDKPRNFPALLRGQKVRVIAEIKRASPSQGRFEQLFDPRILAQEYAGNGAAAISCVTEEKHFDGDGFMVHRARDYMPLPVLRKDFIVDDYQVYESRALEADAILLIAAVVNDLDLRLLNQLARELGMAVLVETHTAEEIMRVVDLGFEIVGINNRNLKTMTVDLGHTEALADLVPSDRILVSESGIESVEDVERLAACGVDAVLVGTALMRSEDPGRVLRPLTQVDTQPGKRPR